MVIYGEFLGDWGPGVGSLGSQMVDLGCQDTDWVGENDRRFRCNFTAGQPPSWVHFWMVRGRKGVSRVTDG